jgi:hypothetical protein
VTDIQVEDKDVEGEYSRRGGSDGAHGRSNSRVGDREGKDEKAVSSASANDSFTSHSFRDVWLCSGVIRPSGGRIVVFCPACMRRRVCGASDVGEVTRNTSINGNRNGERTGRLGPLAVAKRESVGAEG